MTVDWFGDRVLRDIHKDLEDIEEDTARTIETKAKRLCPVGDYEEGQDNQPGALRDSIKSQKSQYKDGGWIVSEGNDDVKYGHFVELGVPSRGIPKVQFLRRAGLGEAKRFARRVERKLKK